MGKTTRKCKVCKKRFIPIYGNNQVTCGIKCARIHGFKVLEKERENQRKKGKEKSKTTTYYEKILQRYFNTYIRLRDKEKNCISCGREFKEKFDAGHYFPFRDFPSLRFDEDNVNGQCVYCNKHLRGNIHFYRDGLIKRIGLERVEALEKKAKKEIEDKSKKMKYKLTIDEIKEKINYYKLKIKEYEKGKKDKDK